MRPRVLAIGDSLSIPRASSTYEDTWLYKLKKAHPEWDIISLCEGGRTTDCLLLERAATGMNCLSLYCPDVVIVQLGIVDCAPRLFPPNSRLEKLLRRTPDVISKHVVGWVKKNRGRKAEYAYVPPAKFQSNLEKYFAKCAEVGVKLVVVVAIAHPDERMILKTPTIISTIEKYNATFQYMEKTYEFVHVVNPLGSDVCNALLYEEDGYHFNATAHDLVFASLEKAIGGMEL